MIGLVLTGHGQFSVGVGQALEMIAGKQEAFKVVPFLENDTMDSLENKLRNSIRELQEETEGIVVFADLLGGSPFKAAMLATVESENVEVVVGTNLPMLIEIAMLREFASNAQDVVTQSLLAGKESIRQVSIQSIQSNDDDECNEGTGI